MQVLVMGAGAIGSYFGGKLARSGVATTFVARSRHLAALRERGLVVRSYRGDFALPVKATDDPALAGSTDLVLFCVKSYDTESAAVALLPALGPKSVVLSLQNGVDNEAKIAAIVGSERVLGGAAYIFSEIVEPGVVSHTAIGRIVLGEVGGGVSARALAVADLCRRADIPCEVSDDIMQVKWSKLVFNAALNAMTALGRADVGRILAGSESRDVFVEAMREVERVARSRGIALATDVVETWVRVAESLGAAGSSMLQDVERGRRLEAEALNGVVTRLASEAGLSAPVNRTLYGCLKALDRAG